MQVAYTNVDPTGRFQFHAPDGSEIVVDSGRYETDDPGVIAYLDECPFVQRAAAGKPGKDGDG